MRSVIYCVGRGMTHFRPHFGDSARLVAPPPLTGSTSAHNNEDCKNDCGLHHPGIIKLSASSSNTINQKNGRSDLSSAPAIWRDQRTVQFRLTASTGLRVDRHHILGFRRCDVIE